MRQSLGKLAQWQIIGYDIGQIISNVNQKFFDKVQSLLGLHTQYFHKHNPRTLVTSLQNDE